MVALIVTLVGLISGCGLVAGWNRDQLRQTIGVPSESLRSYAAKKLRRLGFGVGFMLLLLVGAHVLAKAVEAETEVVFSVGVSIASFVVPPLAALLVALLWWLAELLGFFSSRLTRDWP